MFSQAVYQSIVVATACRAYVDDVCSLDSGVPENNLAASPTSVR